MEPRVMELQIRQWIPIYLQYLFEQIPLRRTRGDKEYMADMMPWSESYRRYEEKKQQQRHPCIGRCFQSRSSQERPGKETEPQESI